jgi:hypothetical protein
MYWRSQPDDLVPLCKFDLIIMIVYKHGNICVTGLNRRAGYAIACVYYKYGTGGASVGCYSSFLD